MGIGFDWAKQPRQDSEDLMSELAAARNEETQKSQVDTETTERFIAEKHIGERIKRLQAYGPVGKFSFPT